MNIQRKRGQIGSTARTAIVAKRDVFPTTQRTWIDRVMTPELQDRDALNRHIMAVYSAPLTVYFHGSGCRGLGDAKEVVAGFFADRLAREGFLEGWQRSDLKLRRWLMNAFSFYLSELRRKQKRDRRTSGELLEHPEDKSAPERSADRAFGESVVAEAIRLAAEHCTQNGMADHWGIFYRHTCDDVPYASLAADFRITAARAAVMARTASRHFRRALRDLIVRDGADEEDVDTELKALLAMLESA